MQEEGKMSADVTMNFHDDDLFAELEFKKEKALAMVGMQAEGDAKIEIESDPRRVDTGRLRNSITWATTKEHSTPEPTDDNPDASDDDGVDESQAEEDAVIIGTNVEYAYEIHEGDPSRKLAPNRFLRNAVEKNYQTYRQMIDDVMKE